MLSRPHLGLLVLKRLREEKGVGYRLNYLRQEEMVEKMSVLSGGEDWRSLGERGRPRDKGLLLGPGVTPGLWGTPEQSSLPGDTV